MTTGGRMRGKWTSVVEEGISPKSGPAPENK